MASASKSITLEEEIGAFMIATVTILMIRWKLYTQIANSTSSNQTFFGNDLFIEKPMSCIEIAGLANSLPWPNELRIHAEERFSDNVVELRREVHKPSILGFRWEKYTSQK